MENVKLPIVYVNFGIANRFQDRIEINENLLKFDNDLFFQVLTHEKEHHDGGFSWHDLKHDLTPHLKRDFKLFLFMLRYPKGFLQFSPIFIYKKPFKIYFDYNLILVYIMLGGLFIWLTML